MENMTFEEFKEICEQICKKWKKINILMIKKIDCTIDFFTKFLLRNINACIFIKRNMLKSVAPAKTFPLLQGQGDWRGRIKWKIYDFKSMRPPPLPSPLSIYSINSYESFKSLQHKTTFIPFIIYQEMLILK